VGAELQPEDLAAAAAAAGWPAIGSRRRAASWHFPY